MKITADLAQAIVQRAIKIIRNSLNVMDENGYIIASTDRSRMHQRHEGAILALSEKRTIEITDAMQHNMQGVKPGINLPIFFREQVIGVVGVSGEVEEVRQYGELMRMAAEMTIEHAHEMESLRWTETRREEFVQQWLHHQTNNDHLLAIAARLNINLSLSYGVALCHHAMEVDQSALGEILTQHNHQILKAGYTSTLLVLLVPLTGKTPNSADKQWQRQQQHLKSKVGRDKSVRWVFSQPAQSTNAIRDAFLAACSVLNNLPRSTTIASTETHQLAALINPISDSWRNREIARLLAPLTQKNDELTTSLKAWFDANCDTDKAASALFIHPNTLRYRLKQIELCTQLDLKQFQHRGLLYAALTIQPTSQWVVKGDNN